MYPYATPLKRISKRMMDRKYLKGCNNHEIAQHDDGSIVIMIIEATIRATHAKDFTML
jgi:hypothetical protein